MKKMIKNSETISIDMFKISENVLAEIRELPHVYSVEFENNVLQIKCDGGTHNLIRILGVLQNYELKFGRVYSELPTLNDVFLEITGKALRDSD